MYGWPPICYLHTHTHRHTKQKKAKLTAVIIQLLLPSDNIGMPGTTQTLESSVANPPGEGLVTCRRTVQISQIEVAEPKAPQQLHTA